MPRYKMLVLVGPKDGRHDEFNDWYDNQHVPDLLKIPSFVGAQRFRTGPAFLENEPPTPYAVIYDLEADSLEAALTDAMDGHTGLPIPDHIDLAAAYMIPLTPLGPYVESTVPAPPLPEYKLFIFMDPKEGDEDEFNLWYDNQHVPECLTVSAFRSAQRYVTGPTFGEKPALTRYAVIYDMQGETVDAAMQGAMDAHLRFGVPDFLDLVTARAIPFTPMGPVITS